MKDSNIKVLRSILYAVETGGQVYGNARYDAFVPAYTNSPTEAGITIGAGQWRAMRARNLLKRIKQDCPAVFKQFDTAGIAADLSNYDWRTYSFAADSTKAKAVKAIIGSDAGKKVQDAAMLEDIAGYIDTVKDLGVTNEQAQMMCINIMHLGGTSALERVLKKTSNRNHLESIYAALKTDQSDHSNGNQVGDLKYWSRHVKVRKWILEYTESEETIMNVTANDALSVARSWIGMSRAKGTHKPIIDLYNSHLPLARGYKVSYSDAYCGTTISAIFIKLGAVDLIGGTECGVEEQIKLFKAKGIWIEDGKITPEPGYIICYNWDDKTQPNDGYADHIGIVETVDKQAKTITVIEGNINGNVGRRTIAIGWGCIRGYAAPKYGAETATKTVKTYSIKLQKLKKGSSGEQVKTVQRLLAQMGYKGKDGKTLTVDGDFGANTEYALEQFQREKGFVPKVRYGICASATWKLLLGIK